MIKMNIQSSDFGDGRRLAVGGTEPELTVGGT